MRTSAIFVVAAAAVASAQYHQTSNGTYVCDKPNTNYCLGGDIILRCDSNARGTPGRCSANLSGYPPLGGVASCYESAVGAGDAACQKNCVVYSNPSFTLPNCQPSISSSSVESTFSTVRTSRSASGTGSLTTTSSTYTQPPNNGTKTTTVTDGPVNPTNPINPVTQTTVVTEPNPTHPGHHVTRTLTYTNWANCTTANPPPHKTSHNLRPTGHVNPTGSAPQPSGNGTCTSCNGGNGGNGGSGTATNTPIAPTVGPTVVPVAGATMNTATGMLAIVGFAMAYLL